MPTSLRHPGGRGSSARPSTAVSTRDGSARQLAEFLARRLLPFNPIRGHRVSVRRATLNGDPIPLIPFRDPIPVTPFPGDGPGAEPQPRRRAAIHRPFPPDSQPPLGPPATRLSFTTLAGEYPRYPPTMRRFRQPSTSTVVPSRLTRESSPTRCVWSILNAAVIRLVAYTLSEPHECGQERRADTSLRSTAVLDLVGFVLCKQGDAANSYHVVLGFTICL